MPLAIYEQLPKLIVHGDINPTNVRVKGDEIKGLFDWDKAHKEIRIWDFPHGVLPAFELEYLIDFLKSYQEKAKELGFALTEDELKAIPEIFRLKFIEMLSWLSDLNLLKDIGDDENKLAFYRLNLEKLKELNDRYDEILQSILSEIK